ncbi:MAG: hypothetical protein FWC51_03300 [Proteobacteria bacterium]|nr:hypothetical protein [Pseudomonadota bacterium]
MKKQLSLFIWAAACFGMGAVLIPEPARAATTIVNNIGYTGNGYHGASVADLTSGPAQPAAKVIVNNFDTRSSLQGYTVTQPAAAQPMYYAAPAPASVDRTALYANYTGGCTAVKCVTPAPIPVAVPQPVVQPVVVPAPRPAAVAAAAAPKYNLANPFFQPFQGHVGSLTNIGWAQNSYNFKFLNVDPNLQPCFYNQTGKWTATELFVNENLSFGITDSLSIVGSARYGWDTYKLHWNNNTTTGLTQMPDDVNKKSGFNQWGLGLQWKFMDNPNWIGYIGGYYQWLNIANAIVGDAKVGYKIGDSTLYGLLTVSSIGWDDHSYGNGAIDNLGQVTYFAFRTNVDRTLNVEGGLGLFSMLNNDWSVKVEATLGDYDWHNQAAIGAGIYYQPVQAFALGLYGRMSVWDSANGKLIPAYGWSPTVPVTRIGDVQLSGYSDLLIQAQVFLYF